MNATISVDESYIWQCSKCNRGFIFKKDANTCCQPAPSETPKFRCKVCGAVWDTKEDADKCESGDIDLASAKAVTDTLSVASDTVTALEDENAKLKAEVEDLQSRLKQCATDCKNLAETVRYRDSELETIRKELAAAKHDAWDRLFEAALTGRLADSTAVWKSFDMAAEEASKFATAALAERERVRKGKEGV